MKSLVVFLAAVVTVAVAFGAFPTAARADAVNVVGGGVATFDDVPRLTSYFEVLATIDEEGNTKGEFTCMIVDFVILLGTFDSGTVNKDGSVLLEGNATAFRLVAGDVVEVPFTVTVWAGGPRVGRFVFTDPGHPHDAETVFLGSIQISKSREK